MTMVPFNGDVTQSLKWMQSNAPNITSLVNQKSNWYAQFQTQFWANWQEYIFNLQTANTFGLMIWCIILGVPSQLFGLYPGNTSFAYGAYRQNYVYSGEGYAIMDPNMQGGNFYGGGDTTVLNLNEVVYALQLRYASLVSNGRISFINRMLNFIFNGGKPWDFSTGNYFYVADSTLAVQLPTNMMIYVGGALEPSTDYTISSTGMVTFMTPPTAGMALTWMGSWNWATPTAPVMFGTGDGTTTEFQLVNAMGAAPPVTKTQYLEYRIGVGMDLSTEFVNLLNSPQYGITPCGAGSSYLVVQEPF
jgi:hypothetical protein